MASPLSLDVGYLFLVSSSVFLSMIVQQLFVIPVLSQEGVSTRPSTLPSLLLCQIFLNLRVKKVQPSHAVVQTAFGLCL